MECDNQLSWKHTKLEVRLVTCTTDADRLAACAGRVCYSDRPFESIQDRMTEKEIKKMMSMLHGSAFEHASFTFYIDGLSRVALAQLTRHRLASFSVQSQRYVRKRADRADWFVLPPAMENTLRIEAVEGDTMDDRPFTEALARYWEALDEVLEVSEGCGHNPEDTRYLFPMGVPTRLLLTVNARELKHILGLRCCNRAQWEIRMLAEMMLDLVRPVAPDLFWDAGPQCVSLGYCPEPHGCGREPSLVSLKELAKSLKKK